MIRRPPRSTRTDTSFPTRRSSDLRLAAFEKLYDSLPPMEKNRIKKIVVAAAEKLLAQLQAKEGGPTQKIDSTVGDSASKPQPAGTIGRTLRNGNRSVMTTFSRLDHSIYKTTRRRIGNKEVLACKS